MSLLCSPRACHTLSCVAHLSSMESAHHTVSPSSSSFSTPVLEITWPHHFFLAPLCHRSPTVSCCGCYHRECLVSQLQWLSEWVRDTLKRGLWVSEPNDQKINSILKLSIGRRHLFPCLTRSTGFFFVVVVVFLWVGGCVSHLWI